MNSQTKKPSASVVDKSKFRIFDWDELPTTSQPQSVDEARARVAIALRHQLKQASDPKKSGRADGCWFGERPAKQGGFWVGSYYGTKAIRRVKAQDRKEVIEILKDFLEAVEGGAFDDRIEELRAA